jgi:hypothetical protein
MPSPAQLFVVIGDVHDRIDLALEFLLQLENELQQVITQVFSVGDFGLFLDEKDWDWLTGPSVYRRSQRTLTIRQAWAAWPWPLATIIGNHDCTDRLRDFHPAYFDNKLSYTNAGLLEHRLPGLRVAGLSGINYAGTNPARTPPAGKAWSEIVAMCNLDKLSPRALTYYREADVDELLKVKTPHIVLTHDWPIDPPHSRTPGEYRPEKSIIELLRPQYSFHGHHHQSFATSLGKTKVYALNIISRNNQHHPNPGWAWIGRWDGQSIQEIGPWPL